MKKIQEAVTFIQATKEEAMALANDIVGDADVHALVIQKGFTANPEPVGYMVVPLAKEWVGLTDDDVYLLETLHAPPIHPDFVGGDDWGEFVRAIEAKLKEKNGK